MTPLSVKKPCPSCKGKDCIVIEKSKIRCTSQNCRFSVHFNCPICEEPLKDDVFSVADGADSFLCGKCKTSVSNKKIQQLIESSLVIDHEERCKTCNSPTIHRPHMNIGARCFFFPKCSGQSDLFAAAKQSYVFLDFETTGLEVGKDGIIEIGAIKIDEDGYESPFQSFVSPRNGLPERITQITGITPEMLEGAPSLKGVLSDFRKFVGNAKLVAHNADFDIPWLVTAGIRHELPLSDRDIICTLKWARKIPEAHCSLGALTRKYKIGHANAHRALADAAATKELFFIYDSQHQESKPILNIKSYLESSQKLVDRYSNYVQA